MFDAILILRIMLDALTQSKLLDLRLNRKDQEFRALLNKHYYHFTFHNVPC